MIKLDTLMVPSSAKSQRYQPFNNGCYILLSYAYLPISSEHDYKALTIPSQPVVIWRCEDARNIEPISDNIHKPTLQLNDRASLWCMHDGSLITHPIRYFHYSRSSEPNKVESDYPHIYFKCEPSLYVTHDLNKTLLTPPVPVWYGYNLGDTTRSRYEYMTCDYNIINTSLTHSLFMKRIYFHAQARSHFMMFQSTIYDPNMHAMTMLLPYISVSPLMSIIADYLYNDVTIDDHNRIVQNEQLITLEHLWRGVRLLDPLMFHSTPLALALRQQQQDHALATLNHDELPSKSLLQWSIAFPLQVREGIAGIVTTLAHLRLNPRADSASNDWVPGLDMSQPSALKELQSLMSSTSSTDSGAIDHIYAQLRGRHYVQIVVNRQIYHIHIPYSTMPEALAEVDNGVVIEPVAGSVAWPLTNNGWIQLRSSMNRNQWPTSNIISDVTESLPVRLWLRFVWSDTTQLFSQFQLMRSDHAPSP
jgi:hypothetical protein